MLLNLDPSNVVRARALPDWVEPSDAGLSVIGDDSLGRETYVAESGGEALVATSLPEMVDALRTRNSIRISPQGISHVLGMGFTPLPTTIFDGVFRVGAGDVATVDPSGVSVENSYPWVLSKSRQDEVPSTARLLELMVRSLERELAKSDRDGVLMMSAGKDSVGLAIAIAELGYDIPCVTYRADPGNAEPEYAAEFCRNLGLRHQTVEMPKDPGVLRGYLSTFFERAVAPSADHAIIPFVVTVGESGVRSGGIIDGGGNDGYMGYFASRRRQKKRVFRIRGRWLQEAAAQLTPIDSRINYLARTRSAAAWSGRNMRYHEILPIYEDAIDPADQWRAQDRHLAGMSDADRAVVNMVRQIEGARTPDKVRLVAQVQGMRPILPYCDPELADYSFNLPLSSRFDRKKRIGKILLTQLLEEKLGYDPNAVESGFFEFDGGPFFAANAEYVKEEIYDCDLWTPAVRPLVDGWLDAIADRPFLFHPLLSLFVISGWHNHSPALRNPREDG